MTTETPLRPKAGIYYPVKVGLAITGDGPMWSVDVQIEDGVSFVGLGYGHSGLKEAEWQAAAALEKAVRAALTDEERT